MSTADISSALTALEALSSSPSTSASGPLNILLEEHCSIAKQRLLSGDDPKSVISDLQKSVTRAKKDVEKGIRGWYGGLGNLGKEVEKAFPPQLAAISESYSSPPLFSSRTSSSALDRVILDSLGRRGLWDPLSSMEEETSLSYPIEKKDLSTQLHSIIDSISSGDVKPALKWCEENSAFLSSPPHPSSLPYFLHRSVFLSLPTQAEAIAYAKSNLLQYVPTQPVLQLLTSCLYKDKSPYSEETKSDPGDTMGLVTLFRAEFCRRHGWPKEDPLEVVVDLGARGGALNAIEKARRVMGDRLGNVRTWEELPMEIPLPPSRRYHSVFVCPVSKEQATDTNPPKILSCGHVIAEESFNRLLKGGRRSAKCPYCPVETSQSAAQRLYF